jgi:hypothetical protein
MSPHPPARRYCRRVENYFFTSWYVDRILIRPCPPTKPLGAIKQICNVPPTSTPYSTSWCSGVVGFLQAIEQQLCLIGYIFRANLAGGGIWYPGRIAMGGPNWTIYPGPKNQPYHNQPSGTFLCSANWSCKGKAAMFVATEIRGNIQRLVGEEGMTNWWPGGPFQWVRPLVLLKNTTNRLRFVMCIFWNYGRREGFKASLNCDRADDFDCSARSLASNIRQ